MHQNLAIILRQLCYGKISFIVLVPVVEDRDGHKTKCPAGGRPLQTDLEEIKSRLRSWKYHCSSSPISGHQLHRKTFKEISMKTHWP